MRRIRWPHNPALQTRDEAHMRLHRSLASATGGLSDEERLALNRHHQLWAQRANRTTPIERETITAAIKSLYSIAGLAEPLVVIVSSPAVMAFAGTFASAVWEKRKTKPDFLVQDNPSARSTLDRAHNQIAVATVNATIAATSLSAHETAAGRGVDTNVEIVTRAATYDRADVATAAAMDRPTNDDVRWSPDTDSLALLYNRVRDAMRDKFGNEVMTATMSRAMDDWAYGVATGMFDDPDVAEHVARRACSWWKHSASGNAGAYWDFCITAARDVLGLRLPEYSAYTSWEQAAIHGGFRYMHHEFCLVSDFPAEAWSSRTSSAGAAAFRWRDGWEV